MRKLIMMAGSAVIALTLSAAGEFKSVGQAQAAFATNSAAVREKAYRYVVDAVNESDGKNMRLELQTLKTMAVSLSKVSEYEEICVRGLSSSLEPVRFACLSGLMQSPGLADSPTGIVSRVETALKDELALDKTHRLEIVKSLADLKASRLLDLKGATTLLDEALARPDADPAAVVQLRQKKMELFKTARQDAGVELEANALLDMDACPPTTQMAATYALVEIAAHHKDGAKAGELLLGLVRKSGTQVPVGIARKMIESGVSNECLAAAVDIMRQSIADMPACDAAEFRTAVEKVQPEVIEILNRLGRCDEALAECRVLVFCASPRSYQAAVNLAAASFKRADGNLGRAMAFMDFQKKDVVPKGRNIILIAPQLSDKSRTEARKSLTVGGSELWTDSLSVSLRLLWLDDPAAAVREAMHAFALAPFDGKALQQCADAIMQPVLVATRDPASSIGIVDYLMYGENGRDGLPSTDDDLASPLKQTEFVLAIGRKE